MNPNSTYWLILKFFSSLKPRVHTLLRSSGWLLVGSGPLQCQQPCPARAGSCLKTGGDSSAGLHLWEPCRSCVNVESHISHGTTWRKVWCENILLPHPRMFSEIPHCLHINIGRDGTSTSTALFSFPSICFLEHDYPIGWILPLESQSPSYNGPKFSIRPSPCPYHCHHHIHTGITTHPPSGSTLARPFYHIILTKSTEWS